MKANLKNRWAIGLSLLLFSLISAPSLMAQQTRIQELQEALKNAQGTEEAVVLYNLGRNYYSIDLDSAAYYIDLVFDRAKLLDYDYGKGLYYFGKAYIHHLKEEHHEAEQLYLQSIPIFLKAERLGFVIDAYGYLGSIYSGWGQYQISLDNYQEGLKIARQQNDGIGIGVLSFGMADTYSHLGQYQKGIDLLEESKEHISHRSLLTNYYSIQGNLYRKMDKLDLSLTALQEAIAICEELTDTLRMAYVSHDIGLTYLDLGEYEKAGKYFFTTIRFNEKLATPALTLLSNLGLGELYLLTRNYDSSWSYYQQALQTATTNQINEKISACYMGLGKVRSGQGRHQEALAQFQKGLSAAQQTGLQAAIIDSRLEIGRTQSTLHQYQAALQTLTATLALVDTKLEQPECLLSELYGAIGQLHFDQGQMKNSIENTLQGLNYAKKCSNKSEEEFHYKQLYTSYLNLDSVQQSLYYYEQYVAIRDTLLKANNKQELISLLVEYDTEQKEKTISLLKKEQQIQEMNMRQQRLLLLALGVALALSILLFWLFFNRYKLRKKAAELELKSQQMELEKRNFETSQQLKLAELRSNLFTDISHELRTPLTLLIAPLEELLHQNKASTEQQTLKLMHFNALRLLELVNQTLDFSKLDHGHLNLEITDCQLNQLLEQLEYSFSALSKIKKVRLHIDNQAKGLNFSCDRDKIKKVLSNLLSNAFEHTPAGGRIDLRVKAHEKKLHIEIRDTGKGIPAQHLPYIFDRFYQVDQHSRKGSGIGLALAQELVQLHGGTIGVNSEVDNGSTFYIHLPLHQKLSKPEPSTSEDLIDLVPLETSILKISNGHSILNTEEMAEAMILVVEDHQDLREYIVDLLKRQGFKVIAAVNGREAMALALQFSPELVISDIMMPEVDGFTLTQRLKEEFMTSHIPIILLTAKTDQNSKLEGLNIGADEYLGKPFHASELLIRSRNLIQQRRQLRQLFEADPSVANRKLSTNILDEEFMGRAISLVEKRMEDSAFNVERFCQEIGMSRTNLYNKLKALTGKNIAEFIRMIRLRKAAELIENNGGNIFEIATQVGFNTRQAFNKAFKERFGLTPSAYKQSKKVFKEQ